MALTTAAQHRQYTDQAQQAMLVALSSTYNSLNTAVETALTKAKFELAFTPANSNEAAVMVALLLQYSRKGWNVQVQQDNNTTITTASTIRFSYASLLPEGSNPLPGQVQLPAAWDQNYHTVLATYI